MRKKICVLLCVVSMTVSALAQAPAEETFEIHIQQADSPAEQFGLAVQFAQEFRTAEDGRERSQAFHAAQGHLNAIPMFWSDSRGWVFVARLERHRLLKSRGDGANASRVLREALEGYGAPADFCHLARNMAENLIAEGLDAAAVTVLSTCSEEFAEDLEPSERDAVLWRLAFAMGRAEMVDDALVVYKRLASERRDPVRRAVAAAVAATLAVENQKPADGLLAAAFGLLSAAERNDSLTESERAKLRSIREGLEGLEDALDRHVR